MRRIEPVRRERARAVGEPEDGFSYYVRSLTTVQLAQDTTKYFDETVSAVKRAAKEAEAAIAARPSTPYLRGKK